MYTFWREVMYTLAGGRVKSNVHILEGSDVHIHWQGEGLKAMYTFWREVMYTFIGRGRVKSNVHILEGSDVHTHWQGEG